MALKHDPPHIRLYDWPNVPKRAREIADQLDIEGISCVAVIPEELYDSSASGELDKMVDVEDVAETYRFIH